MNDKVGTAEVSVRTEQSNVSVNDTVQSDNQDSTIEFGDVNHDNPNRIAHTNCPVELLVSNIHRERQGNTFDIRELAEHFEQFGSTIIVQKRDVSTKVDMVRLLGTLEKIVEGMDRISTRIANERLASLDDVERHDLFILNEMNKLAIWLLCWFILVSALLATFIHEFSKIN